MKSQPDCGYSSDDPKCRKCTLDHKGCFWDGMSRTGQTEKRLRTSKKAADAVVDLTGDDGAVAGPSRAGVEVVILLRPKRQVRREASPTGKYIEHKNYAELTQGNVLGTAVTSSDVDVRPLGKDKGKGKEVAKSQSAIQAASEMVEIRTEEIRRLHTRAACLVEMADQLEARTRSGR